MKGNSSYEVWVGESILKPMKIGARGTAPFACPLAQLAHSYCSFRLRTLLLSFARSWKGSMCLWIEFIDFMVFAASWNFFFSLERFFLFFAFRQSFVILSAFCLLVGPTQFAQLVNNNKVIS